MRRRCPLWISILMARSGAFSSRRLVVRLWCWSEVNPVLCAIRTAFFWIRNPVMYVQVRLLTARRRTAHAQGDVLLCVDSGVVL